jgi:hypothetical protein
VALEPVEAVAREKSIDGIAVVAAALVAATVASWAAAGVALNNARKHPATMADAPPARNDRVIRSRILAAGVRALLRASFARCGEAFLPSDLPGSAANAGCSVALQNQ